MKLGEVMPSVNTFIGHEVFDHPTFIDGQSSDREKIMNRLSQCRYELEQANPFQDYLGVDLKAFLRGKSVLDLGCFCGGATVAWAESYEARNMFGIDFRDENVVAAQRFAAHKGVRARFSCAAGENLPFANETFDAALTFDVLEHVQDIPKVVKECYRVLKMGGVLCVVFPSYFQPVGHHLSMVTKTPCLHWFFSSENLIKAYNSILDERGTEANWYRRKNRNLEWWERGNTINGTTCTEFRRLIRETGWKILLDRKLPLFGAGQLAKKHPVLRLISLAVTPLVQLPLLEELFSHRIVFILQKPELGGKDCAN